MFKPQMMAIFIFPGQSMDPATITLVTTILTGAAGELLGGISATALTAATKKLVQKFQKSRLQKDFDGALPKAAAKIEKTYGRQARVLLFLDCLGRHAEHKETHMLFTEATNAYLFKNLWSRHHLPELLLKFSQTCGPVLPGYDWPQADEDFAEFFRRLEDELATSPDWRELLNHHRLNEIALAAFNISGDTKQIAEHLKELVRQSARPRPDLQALRETYLRHLKNQFEELDFRGIAQVRNLVKLPLRRVFVPLSAEQELERETKEERQQGAKSDVSRLEELAVEQAEKERRVALKQLVTDNPYLAILGNPGSGKSTTLKYICLMFAENEAETQLGLEPQWLPIFFPTHRRLLRSGVKRNRKRLRALRRGYRDGKFSREKVNASVQAWLGHVRHGHTWGLRRALFGNIFS
jgi:hypothetical protein